MALPPMGAVAPDEKETVTEALDTLRAAVHTAKGRSALAVLETELQAGNGQGTAPTPNRGGFGGAKGIVRQMMANRAAGARGGGTA